MTFGGNVLANEYTPTHTIMNITVGYDWTLSTQSERVCVLAAAEELKEWLNGFLCMRGVLAAVGHYGVNMSVSLLVFQWMDQVRLCEHECKL